MTPDIHDSLTFPLAGFTLKSAAQTSTYLLNVLSTLEMFIMEPLDSDQFNRGARPS